MKSCARALVYVLMLLVMSACSRKPISLTETEKHRVTQLTQNLKTRCVGRYLIDIPADALAAGGGKIEGVNIESMRMSREEYLREVTERKAELRATTSLDQYPFLYADDEVNGQSGHYFIHRGNRGNGPARRVIEGYKWDSGYRFKVEVEGVDYLHPDQTYEPYIRELSVKNDTPDKTRLVLDLIKRLRWRPDDDVPIEPGICIVNGFLPGKSHDNEDVWAQFALAENRDVCIILESNSSIREDETLLQRGSEINRDLTANGGRTIRKGNVTLPGINAEEWLFSINTDLNVRGNKFTLEANSTTSSAQSPMLILDLLTGSPNAFMEDRIPAASMGESEAIALWDVMSRTLRPRPNGF